MMEAVTVAIDRIFRVFGLQQNCILSIHGARRVVEAVCRLSVKCACSAFVKLFASCVYTCSIYLFKHIKVSKRICHLNSGHESNGCTISTMLLVWQCSFSHVLCIAKHPRRLLMRQVHNSCGRGCLFVGYLLD